MKYNFFEYEANIAFKKGVLFILTVLTFAAAIFGLYVMGGAVL